MQNHLKSLRKSLLGLLSLVLLVSCCVKETPHDLVRGYYLTQDKELVLTNSIWPEYKTLIEEYPGFISVVSGITNVNNHIIIENDIVILDSSLTEAVMSLLDMKDALQQVPSDT